MIKQTDKQILMFNILLKYIKQEYCDYLNHGELYQ